MTTQTLLDIDLNRPLFRYFADAHPEAHAWHFAELHALGTIGAIRQRAIGGFGVAVLPLYFVAQDLQDQTLIDLFPEVSLQTDHFRLVWLANHPQADEILALSEDLRRIPLR